MKKRLNSLIIIFLGLATITHASAQIVVPGSTTTPETDTVTQRGAPQLIEETRAETESGLAPFGSNLFKGTSFSTDREDGLNPEYIIQPGDRITLRIWGATTLDSLAIVDAQGNIFIPEVGPIRVEGIRNADLNRTISGALQRVFTKNINVYTNLQSTTPVQVFVTGFVNRPGSYAGVATDSILYFLERAGGIDLRRGSYRDVRVMRGGEIIANADLYDFLLEGRLPRIQFTDGDTIIVEKRGDSITAEGAVRNSFSFEIPTTGVTGKDLVNFARPWSNATYVTILGTRNNEAFSKYILVSELEGLELLDGDQIVFEVDQVHDNILIRVEGSHIGQSRFSVPRNTHLLDILDYIKVDPELADMNSISLRRESLRIRQKEAIMESLTRLETAVLSRSAITSEGAQVQLAEAQLISDFVQRARQVEPAGILVVSKEENISNVLLQPNDIITIPVKTNVIQISGEVMVPQALVHEPGNSLEDYIDRVGGYTEHADKGKHMIIRRNGEVIPVYGSSRKVAVLPGDEIISLPKVPSKNVEIIRMVTDTMFKVASAAAIFIRL